MAVDSEAIAAEIEKRLKLAEDEADDVTAMAIVLVQRDAGITEDEMLPDDTMLFQGLVLLGIRLYQDTPNTPLTELNQEVFSTLVQPTVLYRRLDYYWAHLVLQFGLA